MSLISNFLKSKDSVHAKPYVYWNTPPPLETLGYSSHFINCLSLLNTLSVNGAGEGVDVHAPWRKIF